MRDLKNYPDPVRGPRQRRGDGDRHLLPGRRARPHWARPPTKPAASPCSARREDRRARPRSRPRSRPAVTTAAEDQPVASPPRRSPVLYPPVDREGNDVLHGPGVAANGPWTAPHRALGNHFCLFRLQMKGSANVPPRTTVPSLSPACSSVWIARRRPGAVHRRSSGRLSPRGTSPRGRRCTDRQSRACRGCGGRSRRLRHHAADAASPARLLRQRRGRQSRRSSLHGF